MLPKFTTNSSKVLSLEDYEKSGYKKSPYDAEAIYRPLEIVEEQENKTDRICMPIIFLLIWTIAGYVVWEAIRSDTTITYEQNLFLEIIGKQNVTVTPIYYSIIPDDKSRVRVAVELSSPMIIETNGTDFHSHDLTPTLIWFPPTPSATYWAMEYVHVDGYFDNVYNVHVKPITVVYSCEIATSESGPWKKIAFSRTYNVDSSNFSYHTLDDSREPAPWDAEANDNDGTGEDEGTEESNNDGSTETDDSYESETD